jgi:hypothetical protein
VVPYLTHVSVLCSLLFFALATASASASTRFHSTSQAASTMRSSTSLALFAASAAAQSMSTGSLGAGSAVIFNPAWELPPTLTLVGSDATATTYKNDCPSSAGVPLSLISK